MIHSYYIILSYIIFRFIFYYTDYVVLIIYIYTIIFIFIFDSMMNMIRTVSDPKVKTCLYTGDPISSSSLNSEHISELRHVVIVFMVY